VETCNLKTLFPKTWRKRLLKRQMCRRSRQDIIKTEFTGTEREGVSWLKVT